MRIPPFSTPGRFWRGNLHAHSTLSDGALPPADVVEAYKRAGYDFLQLSDHFLARFDWPIADTRKLRCNAFTTLIGAEVHAMRTSAGEYWHIVATGLPLDFAPAERDENGPQLAARAREAGAFVTIAHPSWSQLTIEDGRSLAAAHAVEIYNHTCAVMTDRGDGFYLLDQLCNENRRLTAVAGDDAHFHNGDLDAFGGSVMVKSESLDPGQLVDALKAGHFYSSQGPRIYDIEVTRAEARVDCSPVHTIALVTSASPSLSRVGRGLTHATIEFAEVAKYAWTEAPPAKWFRIVVIDGPGRRAWTNPIWADAFN
jgi:histidinol phosphatase-like PHP family hydrolase